ncbi:hypothetical protein SUGI_0544260 [Cryptomeria japonica]|nr:hypothetical protein SUGI_0544260 [Cryptomeria japonica]
MGEEKYGPLGLMASWESIFHELCEQFQRTEELEELEEFVKLLRGRKPDEVCTTFTPEKQEEECGKRQEHAQVPSQPSQLSKKRCSICLKGWTQFEGFSFQLEGIMSRMTGTSTKSPVCSRSASLKDMIDLHCAPRIANSEVGMKFVKPSSSTYLYIFE